MGKHVFYGLLNTTLYVEAESIPEGWDTRFNSSFRPVFWGCEPSEDGSYAKSFTTGENMISNANALNGISAPTKVGYEFVGWSTVEGGTTGEYTSKTISEAAPGTLLYSIWDRQSDN